MKACKNIMHRNITKSSDMAMDQSRSNSCSIQEEEETRLECSRRLRSLSVNSNIFTDDTSILDGPSASSMEEGM